MKKGKSIFYKIIGCFILYAILAVVTVILFFALEAAVIGQGNIPAITPEMIIDENGEVKDLTSVEALGGWVEELDSSFRVKKVFGSKQTEASEYTATELLCLTEATGQTEYIALYKQDEKRGSIYLVFFPRQVMKLQPTIIMNDIGEYGTFDITVFIIPVLLSEILLFSLYLRRKIKKPLDHIIDGMAQLREGDDKTRINMKAEAEFRKIADSFNEMAGELEREKNEKARMERQKSQMLLELSHDIKTPIATIKSYANALEEGLVPEEKKQNYYRTIDAKAERVKNLSEDMFVMLKMDNPEYEINAEQTDLCEYLRRICVEYYDEITDADFEFEIDIPEEPVNIMADKGLMNRVIANLLDNAMKYNHSGKYIGVRLIQDRDKVIIDVSDDGKEIEEKFAARLFEAFARGDAARKTDGGTGLGLAITQLIVKRHGGTVEYLREAGKNIFRVTLQITDL